MGADRRGARAGLTLLLVGAILQMLGGLLIILIALFFFAQVVQGPDSWRWLLGALGVLDIVGGEVALSAYRRGRANDLDGAFKRGLLASLLPPVQAITLIGAILCKAAAGAAPPSTAGPATR